MGKTRIWTVVAFGLIGLAVSAHAQRKAGLWEVTSSVNMAGMPAGMGSHTQQVCVTQAMIDKYGGPYSNPQNQDCQMTNLSLTPAGMSANLTCSGRMSMTGTVHMMFVDANTTKTTVQMSATLPNGQAMNMTMNSTSTYKGPDCGSVQPLTMPASQ